MLLAEPYPWVAVLAASWLLLVGWPVAARRDRQPSVVEMGFVRRGERGAIGTAAAVLFADGLVQVTRKGALARSGAPARTGVDPFAAAVYAAMPTPAGLRALSARPRVRTALAALKRELAITGLIAGRVRWALARVVLMAIAATACYGLVQPGNRPVERIGYAGLLLFAAAAWVVPRRTVAGHRTLRALRRQHAHLFERPAAARPDPLPDAATAYALRGVATPGMETAYDDGPSQRGAGGWSGGSDAGPDPSWP